MRGVRLVAVLSVAVSVIGTAVGSQPASGAAAATGHGNRAATSTPGPVTRVHAGPSGSTAISLSWNNPAAAHFVRTVIRMSTGNHAPASPTSGRKAALVGRARHAVTVGHLKPATHYRFALFATDGHGHFARRAVAATTTAPGSVRNLRAFADNSAITLTWAAPATAYTDVVVRYAKGGRAPQHPWQGRAVTLTGKKVTTATLPHLAADSAYTARVWTRDHAKHASTPATAHFTTTSRPKPSGRLTGRVTDAAGHPLDHARVIAYSWNLIGYSTFTTSTAADGTFGVSVPPGDFYVDVVGTDATGGTSDATGYLVSESEHAVASRHTTSIGTVLLASGGAVAGRVTDGDGHPLAGVDVSVADVEGYVSPAFGVAGEAFSSPIAGSTSADDGTFTVKGIPAVAVRPCYDASSAHLAGGPTSVTYVNTCSARPLLPGPGATRALPDVHLTGSAAAQATGFTGRVTGPNGAGVGDVDVSLSGPRDLFFSDEFTAADGSYTAIGLAPGRYQICVDTLESQRAAGSGPGLAGRCVTATAAAGQLATVDITLPVGAAVSGTVYDHAGHRLAGVSVVAESGDTVDFVAETDARGHYTARNLSHRAYTLCFDPTVAHAVGRPAHAAITCYGGKGRITPTPGRTRTGVDHRLGLGAAITGIVTDGNHRPVPGVAIPVSASNGDDGGAQWGIIDITGADGRYAVSGLRTGKYDVCFDAFDLWYGGAAGNSAVERCRKNLAVTAGRTTVVNGDLPVSARIDVTVHDGGGHPIAGVNATALRSCNPDTSDGCGTQPLFANGTKNVFVADSLTTDGDGTTELAGLAPGNYAVCLFGYYGVTTGGAPAGGYADGCTGSTYTVTAGKGQIADVAMTLNPGGVVTGTVTDTAGRPVRGARVLVAGSAATDYAHDMNDSGEGEPLGDAVTAADGTYSVRSVRPGDRTVCVDAAKASGHSAGGYLDQCLGSPAGSTDDGTEVAVVAGSTTSGTDLQLTAAGGIAGHVTLDGKRGAEVQYIVLRPDGTWVDNTDDGSVTQTNGYGNYKHLRLPAGTYIVCFDNYEYRDQCYKNVTWNGYSVPAKAKRISVTAGQIITGIDADLKRK